MQNDELRPWHLRRRHGVSFLEYSDWSPVRCLFTTRIGGVSNSPYDTLNLAQHVGDDPDSVEGNLTRFRASAQIGEQDIVRVRQIHSSNIHVVDSHVTDLVGDGLVTRTAGILLAVSVADCIPVYLYDVEKRVIGIVHAGWRGTLEGAGPACVERMNSEYGCKPSTVRALLGPGIGQCCFEVSPDTAQRFARLFPGSVDGKYVSLHKANCLSLERVGISCVHDRAICTSCNAKLFFSHRRDRHKTGRMLAIIYLEV